MCVCVYYRELETTGILFLWAFFGSLTALSWEKSILPQVEQTFFQKPQSTKETQTHLFRVTGKKTKQALISPKLDLSYSSVGMPVFLRQNKFILQWHYKSKFIENLF